MGEGFNCMAYSDPCATTGSLAYAFYGLPDSMLHQDNKRDERMLMTKRRVCFTVPHVSSASTEVLLPSACRLLKFAVHICLGTGTEL